MSRSGRATVLAVLAALALCSDAFGAAHPRVFGGAPAPVPGFMGYFLAHGTTGYQWCGGTAIAPKVFLTAAHCVVDDYADTVIPPTRMLVTFNQTNPLRALARHRAIVDRVDTYAVAPQYRELRHGGST